MRGDGMGKREKVARRTGRVVLLFAATAVTLLAASCRGGPDAEEFLRRWQFAYNSHDVPSFVNFYAEKGHFRVPPMLFPASSRDDLGERLKRQWFAFPDARLEDIREIVAEGNRIAFAWRLVFRSRATNRREEFVGASFLTLEDGKIVRQASVIGKPIVLPPPRKPAPKPPAKR